MVVHKTHGHTENGCAETSHIVVSLEQVINTVTFSDHGSRANWSKTESLTGSTSIDMGLFDSLGMLWGSLELLVSLCVFSSSIGLGDWELVPLGLKGVKDVGLNEGSSANTSKHESCSHIYKL